MAASASSTTQAVSDIRSQISSPDTTTIQTLNILRAILGLELEAATPNVPPETGRKAAPKRPAPKTKPPAKQTKRKDAPQFAIHEAKPAVPAPLDVKERKKLATETFNVTLKSLSSTARTKLQQKAATPAMAGPKPPRAGQLLQDSAPNGKTKASQTEKSPGKSLELSVTAKCAGTALECLRQLHEKTRGEDTVDMGLENGGLALLDKLVTLDLYAEADLQSQRLYKQYWKRRESPKASQRCPDVLARLHSACEDTTAEHKFATTLQGQLIRLAILKGPTSLQGSFTEQLRPDKEGSPAFMITHGHQMGFLDAESAGNHLRTLSLALSKLHTTLPDKPSASVQASEGLHLTTIALQIKCMSWKLLGHQPELARELWTPLGKILQKASRSVKDTGEFQKTAEQCMGNIRHSLEQNGFSREVPATLRQYCSADEQATQKSEEATRIEKTLVKMGVDDSDMLLSNLQVCLTRLGQWKCQPVPARTALQRCIEALLIVRPSTGNTEEKLIAMAHLRKAVVSAADEIIKLQKSDMSTEDFSELQLWCVRAVFALVVYCHTSYKMRATEKSGSSSAKSKSNVLLSYAKTVESVLHVEQQAATRTALLEHETHRALNECVSFGLSLQTQLEVHDLSPAVVAFIKGIPLRVSHAFWSRYLLYTEQNRSTSFRTDILTYSVKAVDEGSSADRASALLSLKYEKLSALWVEQKSFSKGQSSLTSAIDVGLEQGMLTSITEASMAQPAGYQVGDSKSQPWRFDQTLTKYVGLSLEHNVPNSKGTWYFDSHGLVGIERAVLLERQLMAALENHATVLKTEQLSSLVQLWEQLCFEPSYRSYQLRTISQLLHLLAKGKSADASDILGSLLALQDPLSQPLPQDAVPSECGPFIAALTAIQWAFASNNMCEKLLTQHWTQLQQHLEECTKSQNFGIIPSPQILLSNIKAVAEYAGVLGMSQIQLDAAEVYLKLLDLRLVPSDNKKLPWLLTAAMASIELGQTTAAGKALATAEKLVSSASMDVIQWSLGYAEYHYSIGNAKKSVELLLACQDQFDTGTVASPRERLDRETNLCRAALLASRVAQNQGNLAQAMQYARQAVKLSSGIWTSLEKTMSVSSSPQLVANDTTLSSLSHDLSNLPIDAQNAKSSVNYQGAKYWAAASIHRTILRHVANLSAHNGMYQDATYFAQQAAKITAWTGCASLRHCVMSELALLYAGAQETKAALTLFPSDDANSHVLDPMAAINYAEASLRLEDTQKAQVLLHIARPAQKASKAASKFKPEKAIASGRRTRAAPVGKTTARKAPKNTVSRDQTTSVEPSPPAVSTMFMKELHSRMRALADELHVAGVENPDPTSSTELSRLTPIEVLSKASVFVHEAMKQFAADPANNAIAETALALPVRYRSVRKSGQMSLLLESPVKIHREPSTAVAATGDTLLQQAYDWLRLIEGEDMAALSSANVALLYATLSRVVLLSTALKRPLTYSPLNIVLQSFRPKDASRHRERCVILAEQQTANRQQVQAWPSIVEATSCHQDYSDLMQDLPASWTILSLGLSTDGKELLLSKIIKGRIPFLMRVPLERPGVDSDEPCEFTLKFAKDELKDIVLKANETAHDSRGQGDKTARKAWYAEREHLDNRLELLLANIESIWLGGFRGLLSPNSPDENLLARFGEHLTQTLEKHLPSRQKKAKSKTKVELHAHVLELFTSVVFEEADADFEDSITDLLYFVVDILQFNGEPNAIDEIDFDAMLVDTIDALRGYHADVDKSIGRHSILVIDKELQAFPWESLPCLRGRPVSRMPSLSAIKERLDRMHSEVYTIPRSGAYILNPSGDLANTQATFSPLLSQLSFESLIASAPSEQDFERLLRENEILLYFGHGSGLQYIRGRTIRKLPKCAVTWLMGCSSAKLTECGLFESYGTPWQYMHAGSPAVVGTLWDVTDRDIDRFAIKALEDWGLLDASGVEEKFWGTSKSKAKGKGKANSKAAEEKVSAVALDEAVATARDVCLLRYLNGAAPVVYGVPVMLD